MNIMEEIFSLIHNEIDKTPLPNNIEYDIKRIFIISKRHDIAHLTGDALLRNNLLTESKVANAFRQQIIMAVYRYEQQNDVFIKICKIFTDAEIKFVPLKGSVIKKLYPNPYMRTSCDIDILVKKEDISKATSELLKNGFETDGKRNYHDVHFYYGNIHLELHFNICENIKQLDGLLSQVWGYVEPVSGYEYREIAEYYVYHHIAHMAYHFLGGGCGIRPFIDLWILKEKAFYDEEKLLPLLENSNLVKFYRAVSKLIDVWFKGDKHDDTTLRMEKYVLIGGVYGTASNSYSVGAATSKGKKKYLLKLAFPRYEIMCIIYPSLKKRKILLPFYYIHRVFIKVFGKDRKRVKEQISGTMSQSKEMIAEINSLLNELELKK